MRLGRSASLLVAFYLLTSAATAYAECAWVLWGQRAESSSTWSPWSRYTYYETSSQCWAKITSLTFVPREGSVGDRVAWVFGTGIYGPQNRAQRTDNGVTIFLGQNASESIAYVCLPDTVDPRRPKEK